MFQIQDSDREIIARLRNCVVTLTDHGVMLFNTSLQYAYDASLKHSVSNLSGLVYASLCRLRPTLPYTKSDICVFR